MESQFDALTSSLEETNDQNQKLNENCGNIECALIESNDKVNSQNLIELSSN